MKSFNTIDTEESIKYYRENFDLDLKDLNKNVTIFDNLEVKPVDMFRLVPMVFLNDTNINLYIRVISKHLIQESRASECHFFNTYFFSKLRGEVTLICAQQDATLEAPSRMKLQANMGPIHKQLKSVSSRSLSGTSV